MKDSKNESFKIDKWVMKLLREHKRQTGIPIQAYVRDLIATDLAEKRKHYTNSSKNWESLKDSETSNKFQ